MDVESIPAETIFNLGLVYGPLLAILSIAAILVLGGYRICPADHEHNLETIAAQMGESREGESAL
ncbi:MAG: hypothetical protein ABGX04_06895 [Myxococcales bacterium]|nr:hypothetical protein [Myxococcales bacterium]